MGVWVYMHSSRKKNRSFSPFLSPTRPWDDPKTLPPGTPLMFFSYLTEIMWLYIFATLSSFSLNRGFNVYDDNQNNDRERGDRMRNSATEGFPTAYDDIRGVRRGSMKGVTRRGGGDEGERRRDSSNFNWRDAEEIAKQERRFQMRGLRGGNQPTLER